MSRVPVRAQDPPWAWVRPCPMMQPQSYPPQLPPGSWTLCRKTTVNRTGGRPCHPELCGGATLKAWYCQEGLEAKQHCDEIRTQWDETGCPLFPWPSAHRSFVWKHMLPEEFCQPGKGQPRSVSSQKIVLSLTARERLVYRKRPTSIFKPGLTSHGPSTSINSAAEQGQPLTWPQAPWAGKKRGTHLRLSHWIFQ